MALSLRILLYLTCALVTTTYLRVAVTPVPRSLDITAEHKAETVVQELPGQDAGPGCLVHLYPGGRLGNKIMKYMKALVAAADTNVRTCVPSCVHLTVSSLFALAPTTEAEVSVELTHVATVETRANRWRFFPHRTPGQLDGPLAEAKAKAEARSPAFGVGVQFNPYGLGMLEERREFLREVMKVKPRIDVPVKRYLATFARKTVVGVHVRRGDKLLHPCPVPKLIRDPVGRLGEGVTFCYEEFYQGGEIARMVDRVARFLRLNPNDTVFLVATDSPNWCRSNLLPPASELGLDLSLIHDYYNGTLAEKAAAWREEPDADAFFDWAVLADVDHLLFLMGSFSLSAGILGRCRSVFLPKFLPGPSKLMSPEAKELDDLGMTAADRSRYRFIEDIP